MLSTNSKRWIKTAHTVLFFLIVADGFAAFGFFMVIRDGAVEAPVGDQIAPLRDHGRTFYVTQTQGLVYRGLMFVMVIGVPCAILSGALLEFGLKIPVFSRHRKHTGDGTLC